MYILDTDTLNYFFRGHPKVSHYLNLVEREQITTSIISKIEVLRGRMDFVLKAATTHEFLRAQLWLEQSEFLISQFPIVPFDDNAGSIFEKFRQMSSYRKVGRADLLIASIVIANRATLVTRNTKDFSKLTQLKIVNWMD
jgi:tRNA(fMet)-specific endonuclease VapC